MKRVVKFTTDDGVREFDTEVECLRYEAMLRIADTLDGSSRLHTGLDMEDIEAIFFHLAEHKEDVAYLLGLKVNDQDDSQKVQFAE